MVPVQLTSPVPVASRMAFIVQPNDKKPSTPEVSPYLELSFEGSQYNCAKHVYGEEVGSAMRSLPMHVA